MDGSFRSDKQDHLAELTPALTRILDIQSKEGAIAWFENGPWDPWNHVESAMALTALGELDAAGAAFDYLARSQRDDGAWFGAYGNALPMVDRDYISRAPAPAFLDSNFCAYPAVGVAHYLLATGDFARVRGWWPMIRRALDFVLSLQRPDGTISWAFEALGTDTDDALLCGNASIAKSLECGIYLAESLGRSCRSWRDGRAALVDALQSHPERFDRRKTGARYAMDWYYPVLAGIYNKTNGSDRLTQRWPEFVISGRGCRCVCDEPWVTVAESCELVMALLYTGQKDLALTLFDQVQTLRDESGVFWMGVQTEEELIWPKERPSWTQAAVILAADALFTDSASSQLLVNPSPINAAKA